MDNIKDLVKKHFNLIEPSVVESIEETFNEETAEMSFGEIKSADGELTLAYEGEELAQGLPIFVVTGEGNIPAPDGEHALEGGITIVTADGIIEAIKQTEEEVEVEIPAEVEAEEHEEKMAEEVEEETMEEEEVMMDEKEEIIVALADVVKEMMEDLEDKFMEKVGELEEKYSAFASAPAAEKTQPSQFKKESKAENYNHKTMIESLIAQKKRK